jgi:Bacteroides conjugative transposon TraK protein
MFQQFKNIDSAFKLSRTVAIITVIGSFCLSIFMVYSSQKLIRKKDSKVMVIANGKIFEAFAEERGKYWDIEVKDHVKTFHFFFFTLQPDQDFIKKNITKALYLADNSAKSEYDNLRENNYYSSLVSANVSQEIECEDIQVNLNTSPWTFRYTGKLRIVRATNIATRSLITKGVIRKILPSDNNPHGLLIERWRVIENKDISVSNR